MWQVVSTAGPGSRVWNQTTYDGRPLVACGASGGGSYMNDFWAFEGIWKQIIPYRVTEHPVSREHQQFGYCPADGYRYLFGGHFGFSGVAWASDKDKRIIWRTGPEGPWENTGAMLEPSNGLKMSAGMVWCPPLDGFLIAGGGNLDVKATYLMRRATLAQEKLVTTGATVLPGETSRFNVNNQMVWADELGKAVFFGGAVNSSTGLTHNRVSLFDPATLAWTDQPTQNTPPGRCNAAVVYRPGKIAVCGGSHRLNTGDPTTRLKDLWELDLATWTWTQLPDAPFDIFFHGGAWHDGKYLFFCGSSLATQTRGYTIAYTPTQESVSVLVPSGISVEVR